MINLKKIEQIRILNNYKHIKVQIETIMENTK